MSDEQLMRGILQSEVLTLGWADQTAFERKGFTPTPEVPYQELDTQFSSPVDDTLAGSTGLGGTFQVRLLYPLTKADGTGTAQVGIGEPTARAKLIKALFPRYRRILVSGQLVKVMSTPAITGGPPQGDRDVTIVRFRFGDR